jgi:hypothetical protein
VGDHPAEIAPGPWPLYTVGVDVLVDVALVTEGVKLSSCTLIHEVVPDKPGISPTSVALKPVRTQQVTLIDGRHSFVATCPSAIGNLESRNDLRVIDGEPEMCLGFEYQPSPITASSLKDVRDGIVGAWEGCVWTPWTLTYWVTLTFRADGTYSANSPEALDGVEETAMYYGVDDDSPLKRYALNDFQDNLQAIGDIDIYFGQGTVRDELRHVTLMGDQLSFELFHMGQYGPITFQLQRP